MLKQIFCDICGEELKNKDKFCASCGESTKDRIVIRGQKLMELFTSVMLVPFLLLNFTSFLVGGIWLLFLGEWRLVLMGFLVDFFIPFIWMGVVLVQAPLMLLVHYMSEKGMNILMMIPAYISMLIGHVAILAWVFYVVAYAIGIGEQSSMSFPYLLFGYCVAAGPFQYMASKEPSDNLGSFLSAGLAQFGYIIFIATYLLDLMGLAIPIIFLVMLGFQFYSIQLAILETKTRGRIF